MRFIDLHTPYMNQKQDYMQAIEAVLDSGRYIGGPVIEELEQNLAAYSGAKYCVGCANGTDALMLALMALGVGPGDEVITVPFTFFATVEVVELLGAKCKFVDIDEETFNLDASQVKSAITDKTKAIIPVSLFGQTCDMDPINSLAKDHDIPVIEDAAQSFGATYNGKRSCNLSEIATTSFFPAKPLGCYGDGGALFTSDDDLAERFKVLRNHGQTKAYTYEHIGMNSRLDAIQAAILLIKMKRFDEEIELRNTVVSRYEEALGDVPGIRLPQVSAGRTSVWAQYCVRVGNREQVMAGLKAAGVPTAIYYPIPFHLQPVMSGHGHNKGDFPVTEKVSEEIFAIPMSPYLSVEDQDKVTSAIKNLL